jgi:diguanylate cyclase (GGDEF)-like protein/PAS domain S-box-containing protein
MADQGSSTWTDGELKRYSRQDLLELLEGINEPFFILDQEWRLSYLNRAVESVWQTTRAALIGRVLWDALPQLVESSALDAMRQGVGAAQNIRVETYSEFMRCWLELNVFPLAGQGLCAYFHDISERKQVEERLRYLSTHDALTGLYNRAYFAERIARLDQEGPFPISVIVADVDGMKPVNDAGGHAAGDALLQRAAAALKVGLREQDVVARMGGDEFAIVLCGTDAVAGAAVLERRRSAAQQCAGNDIFPLRLSFGLAIADGPGRVAEALKEADHAMYQDKQQRRLEDTDSVHHLAALVMASDEAVVGIAMDGTIVNWNHGAERLFGYPAAESLGRHISMLHPPDMAQEGQAALGDALAGRPVRNREVVRMRKDGRLVHVLLSLSLVRDGRGCGFGILAIVREISGHNGAEHALLHSESYYRSLIERTADGIMVLDDTQTIRYHSPAIRRILGFTPEESVGRSALANMHPDDKQRCRELFRALFERPDESVRAELRLRHKDGNWRMIEGIATNLLLAPDVRGIVINYRDVTESKRTQEMLEQRTQALEALSQEQARLLQETRRHHEQLAVAREGAILLAESRELPEVYERLSQIVRDALPDTATFFISLNDVATKCIVAVYGVQDGQVLDISALPPLPLRPLGEGTQSQVIHSRQPLIKNDLLAHVNRPGNHTVRVGTTGTDTQSALFVPMLAKGQVIGVMQVQSYIPQRYTSNDATLLSYIGNTAAIAIQNAQLIKDLQKSNRELSHSYDSTLEGWARALDLRDSGTATHSQVVTELTVQLARALGVQPGDFIHIRRGALLHDIGKIGVPDFILLKPDSLTKEEWDVMRRHPEMAYELLEPIEYLRPAIAIPYCHHEHWDGSGYPRGLKGEAIPLAARIFAVVDVWSALRSDRPYHKAWAADAARQYLLNQSGKLFDPAVVEAFLSLPAHDAA